MRAVRRWSLAVGLVLAACGPATPEGASEPASPSGAAGSPSASADPTAVVSASPAASSTPAPTDAATGLAIDSLVEILVSDLVVRSHPTIDPPSTILAARLRASDRALVVDGPVEASGYEWYLVAPLDRADGSRGAFGWIARASREGDAWVRPASASCPDPVNLSAVLDLQPLERLACFGGDTLTLEAPVVSCGAGGGPWTFDPPWLVAVGGCGLALDASGENVLLVRVPPGGSDPGPGPVTVTGHFDDPAAAGCTATSADPTAFPAPSPEEAVVLCRSQFVLGSGS